MFTHPELLIFDPNIITELLSINMHNNIFEFAGFIFKQIIGTAMGAAFSPTIANIFMSVLFKNLLSSITEKPILIKRYIDDVFLLWPNNQNLQKFFQSLNSFHPSIKFTTNHNNQSIDFLDISIYKGSLFESTSKLDIKTFQKTNNQYQYLHFTSNHPKTIHRGLIIGECIRYIRTNTSEHNYKKQIVLFKSRLLRRGYPIPFIKKAIQTVNYRDRFKHLKKNLTPPTIIHHRPIFKCPTLPKLYLLKKVILSDYDNINQYVNPPLFVTLRDNTIRELIVRAKHMPTDTQLMDIYFSCNQEETQSPTTAILPKKRTLPQPTACKLRRCATCQHFNSLNHFTSTANRKSFKIRQPFSCNSTNVIYLITCSKCKKQYVGKTTKPLRERINHHRTNINRNKKIYVCVHFNFPDHQLSNLTVQVIDSSPPNQLSRLEQYWIQTLETVKPKGLNYTDKT